MELDRLVENLCGGTRPLERRGLGAQGMFSDVTTRTLRVFGVRSGWTASQGKAQGQPCQPHQPPVAPHLRDANSQAPLRSSPGQRTRQPWCGGAGGNWPRRGPSSPLPASDSDQLSECGDCPPPAPAMQGPEAPPQSDSQARAVCDRAAGS